MYQKNRPTCITVIGWVWIILGGILCFSAIMALFGSIMIGNMPQTDPDASQKIPAIFKYLHVFAIGQIGIAILGLISGINFLKLKSWSRSVLEILTWILLLFIAAFGGFFVYQRMPISSSQSSFGFGIMEIVIMIAIFGFYGVPLIIMVKYLRGDKVNAAMIGSAEQGA